MNIGLGIIILFATIILAIIAYGIKKNKTAFSLLSFLLLCGIILSISLISGVKFLSTGKSPFLIVHSTAVC